MSPLSSLREVLRSLSGSDARVRCPACGTPLRVAGSTCPTCEAELLVECRNCGEPIVDDVDACPGCERSEYEVFRIE